MRFFSFLWRKLKIMKKKYTLIVFFLGIILSFSQEKKVRFGVKSGANISIIKGELDELKEKYGGFLGVLIETSLSDRFSLQQEIIFASQGFIIPEKFDTGSHPSETLVHLRYVDVPFLIKYRLYDRFKLGFGGQVSTRINGINEGWIKDYGLGKLDYKGYDFKIDLLLDYEFKFGGFIDVRYTKGLIDLFSIQETGETLTSKSELFQFSVGYKF